MVDLVVAWSGSLERAGLADGLSGFQGKSSLRCWATTESLAFGDCERVMLRKKKRRKMAPRTRPNAPRLTVETQDVIAGLLRKGVSYRKVMAAAGVRLDQVRRIAKAIGLVRTGNEAQSRSAA
jgi:hypothetical protein